MRAARRPYILAAALLCCIILSAPLMAADINRILTKVRGQVQGKDKGESAWRQVVSSRRMGTGDSARTLADSVGQIRSDIGVYMTLGPSTTLTMQQFDSEAARVRVESGGLRASLSSLFNRPKKFEVETPNAVLAARGTDFEVVYTGQASGQRAIGPVASLPGVDGELLAQANVPDGSTLVEVFDGAVDATPTIGENAGQPQTIGAGGGVVIFPDGSMQFFINPEFLNQGASAEPPIPDGALTLGEIPLGLQVADIRPLAGEYPEAIEYGTYSQGDPTAYQTGHVPEGGDSVLTDAVTGILLPSTSGGTGIIEVEIQFPPHSP
ncbi:MAG: FecR domain-containing protein [Armatimonadetes bacterium]|nr:FecR domain-containing protein [Armatimonadota bacterium]